jgi:hypothetical protein
MSLRIHALVAASLFAILSSVTGCAADAEPAAGEDVGSAPGALSPALRATKAEESRGGEGILDRTGDPDLRTDEVLAGISHEKDAPGAPVRAPNHHLFAVPKDR